MKAPTPSRFRRAQFLRLLPFVVLIVVTWSFPAIPTRAAISLSPKANAAQDESVLGAPVPMARIVDWKGALQFGTTWLDTTKKGIKPGAILNDSMQAPDHAHVRTLAGEVARFGVTPPGRRTGFVAPSDANALGPDYYQTSEYMFGTVVVGVVMPQCNGVVDQCSETWTPAMMDQVIQQVNVGTHWWVTQMNGRVSFVVDQQRQVATDYEPINHPQSDESLWIGNTMTHLGFTGSTYFDQVYAYNNWMRQKYGTDWAFTIFVANSKNSKRGAFRNDYFAYSYVPGPFTVATYDNRDYGINNMAAVIAHETGHIFGALDEYPTAKVACTTRSGYLGLQNQNSQLNCAMDTDSIMRGGLNPYVNNLIDPYALGMVGMRTSGGGNLPDPINTVPTVTINPVTFQGSKLQVSGTALDRPYSKDSGHSVTINYITGLKYRVDGSAWRDIKPTDGRAAFHKLNENFSLSLVLTPGKHVLDIQASNRVNNVSPVTSVTVTVPENAGASTQ